MEWDGSSGREFFLELGALKAFEDWEQRISTASINLVFVIVLNID